MPNLLGHHFTELPYNTPECKNRSTEGKKPKQMKPIHHHVPIRLSKSDWKVTNCHLYCIRPTIHTVRPLAPFHWKVERQMRTRKANPAPQNHTYLQLPMHPAPCAKLHVDNICHFPCTQNPVHTPSCLFFLCWSMFKLELQHTTGLEVR